MKRPVLYMISIRETIMDCDAEAPLSLLYVPAPDGGTICVTVAGEIDMATAERFRTGLDTAIDQHYQTVIVDLAGVRFMDSSGIAALMHARNRAVAAAKTLYLVNCQPPVRRVMEISGVYALLTDATPRTGW